MILGETGSQSKESVEVSVWKLCVYMSLFFFFCICLAETTQVLDAGWKFGFLLLC